MPDSNPTWLIWSTSCWTQPLGFKHPEQFKTNVASSILGYFLFLGSTWKAIYIYRMWNLLSYRNLLLFPFGQRGWGVAVGERRIEVDLSQKKRQKNVCQRDLTSLRYYEWVQINPIGKSSMWHTCHILSFLPFLPIILLCFFINLILIMNEKWVMDVLNSMMAGIFWGLSNFPERIQLSKPHLGFWIYQRYTLPCKPLILYFLINIFI